MFTLNYLKCKTETHSIKKNNYYFGKQVSSNEAFAEPCNGLTESSLIFLALC
jgi:hypothetical protein